jgi:hypothetical protein
MLINYIKNTVENIKNIIIKSCFYLLYSYYSNKLWSFHINTKYNKYCNIAFPDNLANYYISFLKYKNIEIEGEIPANKFFSITVYDTECKTIFYIDDLNINNINNIKIDNNKYKINIYNIHTPYALILRFYPENNSSIILPTIKYIYKKEVKEIKTCSRENCYINIKNISFLYKNIIKFKQINKLSNVEFQVPRESIIKYFPNDRAKYLILHINDKENDVIKISGNTPIYSTSGIRYISFMACNLITTSTDNCIGSTHLNNSTYTIYVASSISNAIKKGFNLDKDLILLWHSDNNYPAIIYREIRMDNEDIIIPNVELL